MIAIVIMVCGTTPVTKVSVKYMNLWQKNSANSGKCRKTIENSENNCILAPAADAHMLEYDLVIPSDCVAAATKMQKRHALELIDKTLDGRTTKAAI
jgi:hypothetical protein